jgi:hypothetical protein
MAEPNWSLRDEYMESCNCDYLCPCIYTNPQEAATHDHCTAVMEFRIDEGHFGDTKLDGLKFALVIRSGKVMADGNWIFGGVVDESAPERRQRLPRCRVQADRVHMEGLRRSAAIPDILAFEIEGVASRNRSSVPLYIDNTASGEPPPGTRPG